MATNRKTRETTTPKKKKKKKREKKKKKGYERWVHSLDSTRARPLLRQGREEDME
jgi:hypothetical protein